MRILFSKTAHAIWVSAALLSECGPASAQTVVATGLSNPSALAVDSGYLYFGQLNGSQGYLSRVPRMGGPTENLVYNTAFLDSGTYRGVERIGFTSNKIYFGFGGYVQYEIDESEKNGTALRSLANPSGGTFVGTVGTNIYYLQGFCCITKLPTDGSTGPQTAASGNWVRRVVTDDTSAYFYEYNTREIRKFEAISETVTTLILTQAGETAVAIDQSNVYDVVAFSARCRITPERVTFLFVLGGRALAKKSRPSGRPALSRSDRCDVLIAVSPRQASR